MSPEAEAVFREFHVRWSAGDIGGALELVEEDAVVRPIHGILYSQAEYRGHEGIERWYREMTGPWDSYEVPVEDVVAAPDGVLGILRLIGRRGGESFDARVASECHVRDGRIAALIARDVDDVEAELGR